MPRNDIRGENGQFVSPNPNTPESIFEAYKKRVSETNPSHVREIEFRALQTYFDNVVDHKGTPRPDLESNLGLMIYDVSMDYLKNKALPAGVRRVDNDTEIEVNNWLEMTYENLLGLNKSTLEYLFGEDRTVDHRSLTEGLLRPAIKKLSEALDEISERRLYNGIFLEDQGKEYLVQRGSNLGVNPENIRSIEDVKIIGTKIAELELEQEVKKAHLKQEMDQELLKRRIMNNIGLN